MSFLTLDKSSVATGSAATGFAVYVAPLPNEQDFPCIWLDLHVGGDDYQRCEDEHVSRSFYKTSDGARGIRIKPNRSVRLTTAERIGVDRSHTAVIVNVASRAKHGLIVAPGKIDPGFNPAPLLLVVHNQSRRSIRLRVGDKIAAIAFAQTTAVARPTDSPGHALAPLGDDFEPTHISRLLEWFSDRDWRGISWDILKLMIASILTLLAVRATGSKGR